MVVGLLQGNRLTLLPPEVSEGGGGVGVILVSFACHPPSTYFGVILQVHTIEYTLECHTPSTHDRVYTGVSFPGHILTSRVILGCPVISVSLMSESYNCTNVVRYDGVTCTWEDFYRRAVRFLRHYLVLYWGMAMYSVVCQKFT